MEDPDHRFEQWREPGPFHTLYELGFKTHDVMKNYEKTGEIELAHLSSHTNVVYGSSSVIGMDKETAGKIGRELVAWSER